MTSSAAYMARYHRDHREDLLKAKKVLLQRQFAEDPHGTWFRLAKNGAKGRAKEGGLPFEQFSVTYPEACPVLGLRLVYSAYGRGSHRPDSPSLDRIVPERGYVQGNVRVISYRANQLRSNASVEELRALLLDAERLG